MSLLDDAMERMTFLVKTISPDGYGGYTPVWIDGATFDAAVVLDNSMQARIAEKQGVTALYTVTTKTGLNLQFNDTFRRESDGKIFRVTSDGDDKATPKSAALNMRQVTAKEWALPDGE